MKYIIIGGGVAGQTAAEYLRKQQPESDILIITKEQYTYYSRIFLPHYLAKEKNLDNLILRKDDWYNQNNISVLLDAEAVRIDAKDHLVYLNDENNPISYDKLLLATGSNARKLSFGNPDVKGVYTLRNIQDANQILSFIEEQHVKQVLIIGGGLLGIELGYHLKELDLDVIICEIAEYLLPRQLDRGTAGLLQQYLESKGLRIICGENVEKINGDKYVESITLKSGKEIKTELILQQLGIIPELNIAKASGINVEKGILVNEYMQTNLPDIYAAGDCVQFKGLIWGIIPASLEQSKIAAKNMLGESSEPYEGSFWNTRLKIAGIKLSCFGTPPTEGSESETIMDNTNRDNFLCRKIVIEDDKLKGAILMGPGEDRYFMNNLGKKVDLKEIKEKL